MVRNLVLISVILFSVYKSEQVHFLSDNYIEKLNEKISTWKAGKNFPADTSILHLKKLLGSKRREKNYLDTAPFKTDDPAYANITNIPESFDAREQWKHCETIGHIPDQGQCGTCWAVSTTSAFADRMCIATEGKFNHLLSAEELGFCCAECGNGCDGGYPIRAWEYFSTHGVVTGGDYDTKEGCQPYKVEPCEIDEKGYNPCDERPFEQNHKCIKQCYGNSTIDYEKDHVYTKDFYYLYDPVIIQKDIMVYGPIEATLEVFEDFFNYKSGVYSLSSSSPMLGYHAVKLIGWGVEGGVKYWLLVNSWNTSWGDKGLFKIKRGSNECGIELRNSAGVPLVQ
ncbi:cathepsin B-like isoform X1 [Daktulosphaira vitifoliae]|uniref:cathepsin B-like isoform X1 n=1 Tax=Daktulosphaira vitifoliae TaxID=58002 RepID=UPI0021AAE68D|nr:cathepsin B-like isoform X1 [Daktulosphaira vitifoliae]